MIPVSIVERCQNNNRLFEKIFKQYRRVEHFELKNFFKQIE